MDLTVEHSRKGTPGDTVHRDPLAGAGTGAGVRCAQERQLDARARLGARRLDKNAHAVHMGDLAGGHEREHRRRDRELQDSACLAGPGEPRPGAGQVAPDIQQPLPVARQPAASAAARLNGTPPSLAVQLKCRITSENESRSNVFVSGGSSMRHQLTTPAYSTGR